MDGRGAKPLKAFTTQIYERATPFRQITCGIEIVTPRIALSEKVMIVVYADNFLG